MLSQLYEIQCYNLKVVFIYVWKILRKNKMVVMASIMVRLTPLSSLYLNGMVGATVIREAAHTLVDDKEEAAAASVAKPSYYHITRFFFWSASIK